MIKSFPIYPFKEAGAALILGSAPCVHDDYEDAIKAYPDAKMIGVSRIVSHYAVDHIFKIEKPQICGIVRVHDKCHPGASRPIVHTNRAQRHSPCANYYWQVGSDDRTGICNTGTSGWAAAQVAAEMGFNVVIMCGCPINGTGYMDAKPFKEAGGLTPENFNHWKEGSGVVSYYQRNVRESFKKYEGVIFSMSGFTRDIMGAPRGV